MNVVLDINLLVNAVAPDALETWNPSVLCPIKNKAKAGRLGRAILTIMEAERRTGTNKYSFATSEHVIDHVGAVLAGTHANGRVRPTNKGWSQSAANGFVSWIMELSAGLGGEHSEKEVSNQELVGMFPARLWETYGVEADHEDRNLLWLARETNARVIVTSDVNFLKLGNLGFVRIISPEKFLEEHLGINY